MILIEITNQDLETLEKVRETVLHMKTKINNIEDTINTVLKAAYLKGNPNHIVIQDIYERLDALEGK
jgi:hypothetical protein